jgi:hypothetical protein
MFETKYKTTSADYANIKELADTGAVAAARIRASAALEFAVMEHTWRNFELNVKQRGYDVFAAWSEASGLGLRLRLQLHWLSANFDGRLGEGDPFADVAMRDVEELQVKNANYGESWKRRGGVGAFMMLARKWDRIDNILGHTGGGATLQHLINQNPGDVLDDIGDLRRYLLLVEDEAARWQPPKEREANQRSWRCIVERDLPAVGQEVLLLEEKTGDVAVAVHALEKDGTPLETYWDVDRDQQYAIHERWTHWCELPGKPPRSSGAEPGPNYVRQG